MTTSERIMTLFQCQKINHYVELLLLAQGLEGYYRDPGFDQNMVRDSGKRKISWRDSGFDCYLGSEICQNLCTGCRIFCLSVGNSGNRHDPNKGSRGKSESTRQVQNINQIKGQSTSYIYELLQKLVFFKCIFWERKNEIRDRDEKRAGCGIIMKKERECGISTPLSDPASCTVHTSIWHVHV